MEQGLNHWEIPGGTREHPSRSNFFQRLAPLPLLENPESATVMFLASRVWVVRGPNPVGLETKAPVVEGSGAGLARLRAQI